MKGITQIPNVIFDSPIWKDPEMLRAYCDIMHRVWWEDSKDGKTKKGEVFVTLRKSATRWGWDKNKVSRFLAYLVENNWLKCTEKPSVFSVRDTKSDTFRDIFRDTKKPKRQRVKDTDRDTFRDTKRDTKRDTTPIIGESPNKGEKEKGESAGGTGHATAAPPAPVVDENGLNPDGLPYGVTARQWERFLTWAKENIPLLMGVGITPTSFRTMRDGSLNNTEKFTAILTAMEGRAKEGKPPHVVVDEFYRRLHRWREDKFRGVYG